MARLGEIAHRLRDHCLLCGPRVTGSRGGYLSVAASLLVFGGISLFLLRAARPERWLKVGAVGAGGLAIVALAGGAPDSSKRLSQTARRKHHRHKKYAARSLAGRAAQWELQPVFGTGSGTYRFYGRQFRTKQVQNDPIDVHNDYLHLLCEYGLLGLSDSAVFFRALAAGWPGSRVSPSEWPAGTARSRAIAWR